MPNMLGKPFYNLDAKQLSEDEFYSIRQSVPEHGVIALKDQSLNIDNLIDITNRFGQAVQLPEGLRFNNTLPEYPELARVSNIRPDGTIIENHDAAEYWHVDGDFWQPAKNYIFNFLYCIKVPEQGGLTGFADLRSVYKALSDKTKDKIENLRFISSCAAIPDFKVANPDEYLPDAYHRIAHTHVETGRKGLYINYASAPIEGVSDADASQLLAELFDEIEKPIHGYQHHWQEGDLLIWDNTSVMHRSLGQYGNSPRLLYRTQAFITPAKFKQ